jgi:hypothetical protein
MVKRSKKCVLVDPPNLDSEGYLCIPNPLLWKWRALDAELRAHTFEMDQVKSRISAEISKNSVLAGLFGSQAGLSGQISVAKGELNNVLAEIEALLGVSLKDCAFDDKTGRLYNLAENGTRGEPVQLPKKRRVRKVISNDT